ncbi:MAG: Fis family transcriptional regulator [Proteobacteria bacterium SG_bin7]|nr:MAG: Fis family transcriptional regulator [Proteobacteria bacterium SG_bin7]
MPSRKILIVDDESALRTNLFRILDRKGFQVITANCKKEAEIFCQAQQGIDLALVDLNLPDGNGYDLINYLKTLSPSTKVMIITGFGTIDTAVKATKAGVLDYLTKPFDIEQLVANIELNLKLENQIAPLDANNSQKTRYKFDSIIGESPQIKNVIRFIETVADSDSTILISGESGTGKELVAKAIHYSSNRKNNPFVPVNCGAIPRELLESELFGHVKGAFTGAVANRVGRFELASNGTIFLDEIGDMNPMLQVKLLRVLQERNFEPVGSTKTIDAKSRVITATNINLEEAVERGEFREDLFYRLNVIPIHLPALRERKSDISVLLNHCVERFNKSKGKNITGFTDEVINTLTEYSWPGNVRELENLVERIAILKGNGQVEVSDLPEKYTSQKANLSEKSSENIMLPDSGVDFNTAVDSYENALIIQALEKTGWNRNQAATLLRLNRTTLVEKIKKKGLRPPDAEM